MSTVEGLSAGSEGRGPPSRPPGCVTWRQPGASGTSRGSPGGQKALEADWARMGSVAVQGLGCGFCVETTPCPPSKRGAERTLTTSRPRRPPRLRTWIQHLVSSPASQVSHTVKIYGAPKSRDGRAESGTLHPHRPALLLQEARPLAGCPKWEACAPLRPWDGDAAGSDPDSTLTGPATSGSDNPGQCGRSLLRG